MDALQFVQLGRIVNPSRVSHSVLNAKRSAPDGSKFRLRVGKPHAVCVTAIVVTDSYLQSLPTAGLAQRQLRGIVHSQEWDRLVGFFCMVFHQPELGAQLYKDSLSFTTKTGLNTSPPESSTKGLTSLYFLSAKCLLCSKRMIHLCFDRRLRPKKGVFVRYRQNRTLFCSTSPIRVSADY